MNPQALELIIGAVLPPVIDFVNKRIANSTWRYVVSMIVCIVIGGLLNLDKLSVGDVLGSAALVFGAAQTAYKMYWEKSDVRVKMYGPEVKH